MESLAAFLAELPPRVDGFVRAWANRAPDSPALVEGSRTLSYGQLAARATALADQLRSAGMRAGDRLLVVGENSIAMATALFAASMLDAWAVPVNARLSSRELDNIREHCRPRRSLYAIDSSAEAAAHAQRHGASPLDSPGEWQLAMSPEYPGSEPEAVFPNPAEQVAALLYTSGTTGQPKGVMLTHRNLCFIAAVSARLRELGPTDRVYGVLPISHVFGLASVLFGTLAGGACLVLEPRFAPEKLAHALEHEGITIMLGVPAMYARLLELAKAGVVRLRGPRLRFLYAGGAPLDQSLKDAVESAYGKILHNGYGMTESAPTIAQTTPRSPRRDCSVGMPIPHVEVRYVDAAGRDVAADNAGEVWVRGPNVMKGYYRDPVLTAATIDPAGWLATGDLARAGRDGAMYLVGRSKELIIRSGFNVYPVEVEAVLNSHPSVTQSAVVGRPVEGNEEVIAFVELQPGSTTDVAQLMQWARDRLAPYKRPSVIRILAQLPAAATGKILKHRLKEAAVAATPAAHQPLSQQQESGT